MTPRRPKSLKWIGEMYPDGRPARFLDFVPPEDIDEARTAELTQEQLADIRASGLYREVHPAEPKKAPKKAAAPRSEPVVTDETSAAGTPVTDAGDGEKSEAE